MTNDDDVCTLLLQRDENSHGTPEQRKQKRLHCYWNEFTFTHFLPAHNCQSKASNASKNLLLRSIQWEEVGWENRILLLPFLCYDDDDE
jgi:hypothetical protein